MGTVMVTYGNMTKKKSIGKMDNSDQSADQLSHSLLVVQLELSAATFPGYLQSAELRRSHDFQPEDRGFFVTQMHKGHVSPKDIGLPMGGNSIVSGVSQMGF